MAKKPIRVVWSELTNTFYATNRYDIDENTGILTVTGQKYDVTQEIAAAIHKYGITFTPKESPDAKESQMN